MLFDLSLKCLSILRTRYRDKTLLVAFVAKFAKVYEASADTTVKHKDHRENDDNGIGEQSEKRTALTTAND